MKVTLTRAVTKRCPYREEWDHGDLTITMECDEAPELHDLGERIDHLAEVPNTHEAFTLAVVGLLPAGAIATTRWRTGPWDVTVAT